MPRISSFFGIVITMYHDDHGFPHFHAQHADGHAKIRIDTLEPIESNLPRRQLRFVLAWAELDQAELKRTGVSRAQVAHFRRSAAAMNVPSYYITEATVIVSRGSSPGLRRWPCRRG